MSKKGKQKGEVFKQEDVLQAVVIADSFNVRFAPLTQDKPRTLLPLVNIPMLDYTLEFLCTAGIQHVILFSSAHAHMITHHVNNSKWSSNTNPMEITVISSDTCRSMGDALRDIDAKGIINNDFVLISGDVISNVKLEPIIEKHKQLRLKEKTPIMTLLFKEAPPTHRSRCTEDEVFLAVKPENQRILSYQKVGSGQRFDLPLELFKETPDLEVRFDMMDCHISICSPRVASIFTDEFDYQTRENFIKGILENEEIFGHTLHFHNIEDQYAARVSNLHMYDAVSRDVLGRWCYPLSPDCSITNNQDDNVLFGRHNIYQHKDVTLARGSVIDDNVLIGKGSKVGTNTTIIQSVIGKNCVIGEGVHIEGSYIWDGVVVEDGCDINMSVLDKNVHLKQNVKLASGCVISQKVVLGPSIQLQPATLITSKPPDSFDDEDQEMEPELVGNEGQGYRFMTSLDDSDDDINDLELAVWGLKIESDASDEEEDSEDEDMSPTGSPPPDEAKLFYDEVIGTLDRARTEKISSENIILECNSLKHAYGMQINEVNVLVSKALFELPIKLQPQIDNTAYLTELKKTLTKFSAVYKNYIKSDESQALCLSALEECCINNVVVLDSIVKILHYMYEGDLFTEEAIVRFYNNPVPPDKEDAAKRSEVKKKLAPLVKWLEEAEEESDEDSD